MKSPLFTRKILLDLLENLYKKIDSTPVMAILSESLQMRYFDV